MHVLRHHHIACNREEIAQTNALQRVFKKLHGRDRGEVRAAVVTAKREGAELPCLPITDAFAFH
jgi:hypothetical protein